MPTATAAAAVKVGDVFIRSWGYDQTNVDFFEVVEVSKSGKTAKARQLKNRTAESLGTSDRVVPATGEDRFADARCARCSNRHEGEAGWDGHAFTDLYNWQARHDRVTVGSSGEHAYRWDGQPAYQTGYGFGH